MKCIVTDDRGQEEKTGYCFGPLRRITIFHLPYDVVHIRFGSPEF